MSLCLQGYSKLGQCLQLGTISFLGLIPIVGHTSNEELEIQELREEVKELHKILEKQIIFSQEMQHFDGLKEKKKSDNEQQINKQNAIAGDKNQIKFYGFVRADAAYQFTGGNAIFNRINKVDLEGNETHKNQISTTVATTRLGIDIKNTLLNENLSGKLEIDFRGGSENDSVRIRHAYINYGDWLFGQTTSNFLATEFIPEIVDFGSPTGVGTLRTPIVRYSHKDNLNVETSVALEQGRNTNRLPAMTAKAKYSFSKNRGAIAIRGLIQEIRDVPTKETAFSWGTALGVNFNFTDNFSIKADYSHVKGDDRFMLFTNTAYNISSTNSLNLNEFDSFVVGANYKFSPQLRSTIGYGAIIAKDNNRFAKQVIEVSDSNQNKNIQQGWLNLMYTPIQPLTFGIEYIYGKRRTYLDQEGTDSRIETMIRYDF
ncbi:DcaP family trimeric outer membrane transporter [Acinetobacter pittii]|uniref:DcaP family trimeric outer membrane transporter n=1 Tax=Acinetobacter pittii TaxID=48296 RepID=UPI0038921F7C